MISALRDYFILCPHLLGGCINVNFLGPSEGDVSLEPTGDFEVTRKYCDGKSVIRERFLLSMRCGFDANISMNISDFEKLSSVCEWIISQDRKGVFPDIKNGCMPIKIEVTKRPYLYESSIQGARMQMEFSLEYREL